MSEETAAVFQREGEISYSTEDTSEDAEAASQAEESNQEEDTQSAEGDNTQTKDQETPFHEHPRWKERESEWTSRYNEQERRHQEDMRMVLEKIGTGAAPTETSAPVKMPGWFGGTQEQWNEYRADLQAELKAVEESAEKRTLERLSSTASQEESAVKEATDFLNSEVESIQADKTLNPSGEAVDKEALFKVVYENNLIDTKGRWNYRAGFKLMRAEAKADKPASAPAAPPANQEKKKVAAATTSESKGEKPQRNYATSQDFERDRPW